MKANYIRKSFALAYLLSSSVACSYLSPHPYNQNDGIPVETGSHSGGTPGVLIRDGSYDASSSFHDGSTPMLNGSTDAGTRRDDAGTQSDASLPRTDGGENHAPDAGVRRDAGSPCYHNTFNTLDGLVIQSGNWTHHPEGYLQQTESLSGGNGGGLRIASVGGLLFSDFEARVRIRTLEDINPSIGVVDKHTGVLFRYNPETREGYLVQMEFFNRDYFELSLTALPTNTNIYTSRVSCGSIGCQNNVWRELQVRADGSRITAFLEGEEIFSADTDGAYMSGRVGLAAYSFNASHFDDLDVCEE